MHIAPGCCRHRFILQVRLRARLHVLKNLRRGYHSTPILLQTDTHARKDSQHATQSIYSDTLPPTIAQASAASLFFKSHSPRISWVANEWRKQAHSSPESTLRSSSHAAASSFSLLTPEIAFLGRSNTGKSSLLNALLHSPGLCRVGSRPGKTTTMHAWTLSSSSQLTGTKTRPSSAATDNINNNTHQKLTVLDMPGYGHGSHDDWGADIVKYLLRRRQLRRVLLLMNPSHGIKASDKQILTLLRTNNIPHQIIACKCDAIPARDLTSSLMQLKQAIKSDERNQSRGNVVQGSTLCMDDILAVGKLGDGRNNKTHIDPKSAFGLDEVRWAILQGVGLDGFAMQQWTKVQGKRQQQQQNLRDRNNILPQSIDSEGVPKLRTVNSATPAA